jgi:hypothetical protein
MDSLRAAAKQGATGMMDDFNRCCIGCNNKRIAA